MEPPRFYCGLNHKLWSYHQSVPGDFACISPIVKQRGRPLAKNGVCVPDGTLVLQDSGAFGEPMSMLSSRLTFGDALLRQEQHAEQYNYADKIAYRASYDLLIDHRAVAAARGGRYRRAIERLSESDGALAVDISVLAARFLHRHRNGYPLALNVQGVSPVQYLSCVKQVVPLLRDGDMLGLGGWCILGRKPRMMGDFLEMLALVIPFIAGVGVKRVHLYGCLYTPAIAAALAICDRYELALSLDSAFPSYGPRMGKWGYGSWRAHSYQSPKVLPSCKTGSCTGVPRCVGLECIRHVKLTREWLSSFREREYGVYRMMLSNIDQYCYGQILDLAVCCDDEEM